MAKYYFPVQGPGVSWAPTHWDSDGSGTPDLACDIFAPEGTPIVAIWSGRVEVINYPNGGHTATLYLDPNPEQIAVCYNAHLVWGSGRAGRVQGGQQIGRTGRTGNAATTPPHDHFAIGADIDRYGQGTIPPWPLLRQWQAGETEEEEELSAAEKQELADLRVLKGAYDDLNDYTSGLTGTILPGALGTLEAVALDLEADCDDVRAKVLEQCEAVRAAAGL